MKDVTFEQVVENGKFLVKFFSSEIYGDSHSFDIGFSYQSSSLDYEAALFNASSISSSTSTAIIGTRGTVSLSAAGSFSSSSSPVDSPFLTLYFVGSGDGSFDIDFSKLLIDGSTPYYEDPPLVGYDINYTPPIPDSEVEISNKAPTGEVIVSGTLFQGSMLLVTNSLADEDGMTNNVSYQWLADGAVIADATGSTLLLTQAEVGKSISVRASYTDDRGTVEKISSAETAIVKPIFFLNNLPTGEVFISGTTEQGQLLTASNDLSDSDGMGIVRYQWQAQFQSIPGATESTLLLDQDQVGKVISVQASYTDAFGTFERVTSRPTALVKNVNDSPTGSVTVSGTATQGQKLTAINTLADLDGMGSGVSYQWLANSEVIAGATESTLVLSQAQVGKSISVVASYTDDQGTDESVTSAATPLVEGTIELPVENLSLSGIVTENIIVVNRAHLSGDLEVAPGVKITIKPGATLDLGNHTLLNFGTVALEGTESVYATIKNGKYSTKDTTGILIAENSEIDNLAVDGFFSYGSLLLNNVVIRDSSIDFLETNQITGSLIIDSVVKAGIESGTITETTFQNSPIEKLAWSSQNFLDIQRSNFLGDGILIRLDPFFSGSHNIAISESYINLTSGKKYSDYIFDGNNTLQVQTIIPESSFVSKPFVNTDDGLRKVGVFLSWEDLGFFEKTEDSGATPAVEGIIESPIEVVSSEDSGTNELVTASPTKTVEADVPSVALTVRAQAVESIGLTPDGKSLVIKTNGVSKTVSLDSVLQFSDKASSAQELLKTIEPIAVFSSVINGQTQYVLPDRFTGPAALDLKYQLIDDTLNAVVTGSNDNDFIKLSNATSAGKAVDGGGGNDVIDGGVGSTFISGGGGNNVFFLDGRATGVSWSTITDFSIGADKATIWGWKQGVSQVARVDELGGAPGYQGVTLHFENLLPSGASDADRNGSWNSITFSGKSLSDFGASSLEALNAQIAAGTNSFFSTGQTVDEFGTHGYLHVA
jgi:hypothetical protein